jgi:hypothetical protein
MDPQTPSGNGTQPHSPQPSVAERAEQLGESAQAFLSNAQGAAADLADAIDLKGRVDRNPYAMVGAALGVGYVLGGGLFTPLTGRIFKLAVRLAAVPFVKDELMSMAESAVDGFIAGAKASSDEKPE